MSKAKAKLAKRKPARSPKPAKKKSAAKKEQKPRIKAKKQKRAESPKAAPRRKETEMTKKKKDKEVVPDTTIFVDEDAPKETKKAAPKPPEKLHKVLAPLKNLPGSLQVRGEALCNYALYKTASPEAIVKDAAALIKEAESMGLGPFADIKKSLKG